MGTEYGAVKVRFETDGAVMDITDADGCILASATLLHYEAVGEVERGALRFARERGWLPEESGPHWRVGAGGLMTRRVRRAAAPEGARVPVP
ncbi:hypothetical protein [Streptomyces sp. x-80]|jgi:hypothetical protein|uniref:hypothetical protein n=1 Tax=Streptomyces sp. x-80 TaxID=2789282 RepID=UPI0039811B17